MEAKFTGHRRARSAPIVVYAIRTREADAFMYVGFTKKKAEERLRNHLANAKSAIANRESSIFQDWLVREPSAKVVEVLERVKAVAIARKREKYWIAKLIQNGHPLLNTINAPDPPGKFRCCTFPCKKVIFSSRWSAELHRRDHKVEKCSLAAYPFALDPDTPREPCAVKRLERRLYYRGVKCNECGGVIWGPAAMGIPSGISQDGTMYRVCQTCDYNESCFEDTDECGYNFVLAN